MKLFETVKSVLGKIQEQGMLIELTSMKEKEDILILWYIHEKGLEQDVLAKNLHPLMGKYGISETFYGYLLWIAGELMNNVFDHGQTLGKVLKGGIFAFAVFKERASLAVGDIGIGIQASLEKNPEIQAKRIDAKEAILLSLTENVSGWPYQRGNGLPDVARIVKSDGGGIMIYSDDLVWSMGNGNEAWKEEYQGKGKDGYLQGVIVAVELPIRDFTVPRRGQPKGTVIKLSQFGTQLSGREKGQEAYEMLVRELVALPKGGALLIDCTGVIMMNSSFGDQALGVLLENIKAGHFGAKKVFCTGEINEVVSLCLDRIAEIREVEVLKV